MRPAGSERLWRAHARQIGEIAIAWNWLHTSCFRIFQILSEAKNPRHLNIAHAIWHSLRSDSEQRQLMLNVARHSLLPKSRVYLQIKWLKETADRLASSRNDPVHTPIALLTLGSGKTEIVPDIFYARREAVDRLQKSPLGKNWQKIRGDIRVLSLFASIISRNLEDAQLPLPRKPRMLSLPKSTSRKNRRRRVRGKPPPPP